jgi:RNA polymerase sigma-70 factor (ECF subfamily)
MCRVRDGDVAPLGELFARYRTPLFNFFLRMDGDRQLGEDLVQEVFVRILRFRQTFHDATPFATWMYQIARNARIDHYRRRHAEVALNEELDLPLDGAPHAESRALATERETLLNSALARLAPAQRELLVLSRFQELKYHQIAALLDCEPGTVKTRIFRAMAELRRIFFELAGTPGRLES